MLHHTNHSNNSSNSSNRSPLPHSTPPPPPVPHSAAAAHSFSPAFYSPNSSSVSSSSSSSHPSPVSFVSSSSRNSSPNFIRHHSSNNNSNNNNVNECKSNDLVPLSSSRRASSNQLNQSFNNNNNNNNNNSISSSSSSVSNVSTELVAFTAAIKEMMRTNAVRANRQQEINEVNSQLHAMSFFMNYSTAMKTKSLMQEYDTVKADIVQGKQLLHQMQDVMESQEQALQACQHEVVQLAEGQQQNNDCIFKVEEEVERQREELRQAMDRYELKLREQEAQLAHQEEQVNRLLSVRIKIDFAIDVCVVLLSWYASHSDMLTWLVRTLTSLFIHKRDIGKRLRNRRIANVTSAIEFVLFIGIVRRLRKVAIDNGVHNTIVGYLHDYVRPTLTSLSESHTVASVSHSLTSFQQTIQSTITSFIQTNNVGQPSSPSSSSSSSSTSSSLSLPPPYHHADAYHISPVSSPHSASPLSHEHQLHNNMGGDGYVHVHHNNNNNNNSNSSNRNSLSSSSSSSSSSSPPSS